jgi:hypothetical protein
MARRANPAAGVRATEEHEEQVPLMGGSAGIPEGPRATPTGGNRDGVVVASAQTHAAESAPDAEPMPAPKRFIVEAHHQVQYGGVLSLFRAGKIVDDSNFDLDNLRRQGVRLRQLS